MAKKQLKTAPEAVSAASAAATKPAPKTSAKTPVKSSVKTANHTHSKSAKPIELKADLAPVMETAVELLTGAEPMTIAEPSVTKETLISAETLVISQGSTQDEARVAIEKLAYGYFAARGFHGGNPLEDWVRAEREFHGRS